MYISQRSATTQLLGDNIL